MRFMAVSAVLAVLGAVGCERELTAQQPAAESLLTVPDVVRAVWIEDERVYIGTGSCVADPTSPGLPRPTGSIMSVPLAGGAPTPLWKGAEVVVAMVTWKQHVFMLGDGQCVTGHSANLRRVPVAGGPAEDIALSSGGLACPRLLPTDNALFWIVPGAVHRYDGQRDTTIAAGYTCDGDMAASADRLIWASANSLNTVSLDGGTPNAIWQGTDNIFALARDPLGRGFYVRTPAGLVIVSAEGQTRETIGAPDTVVSILADDHYAYWSQPGSGRMLARAWQGGEPAMVISPVATETIAQTERELFWVEYDRQQQTSVVRRIAKPAP
jgi:hypothetical protein